MLELLNQLDPGSPEWMVYQLDKQLCARLDQIERFDSYYRGDHPLPKIPDRVKDRETFQRLLKESRSNWMKLVIDVVVERLFVQGFEVDGDDGTPAADEFAAEMWDANDLVVGAEQIHQESCLHGVSYALVGPDPQGELDVLVTPEHPGQVIVACDAETRRRRLAGWKRWLDDDGYLYGTLYLPDTIVKLRSTSKWYSGMDQTSVRWEPRPSEGNDYEAVNPIGVVPIVPFVNQPRIMKRFGVSDIRDLTDTQDRINELLFGMLVSAQYAAFRQRWISGLSYKKDERTGEPVFPFDGGAEEVWGTSNAGAKFGEFGETTLEGYIKGIEASVQHLAAQSRTPPHYLLGQSGAFPSGESLKSTETGLVAKVVEHQAYFTAPWREVRKVGGLVAGKPVARAKVLWKDPESRTLGELTDSLVKMAGLGVPRVVLWSKWGATPDEVADWKVMSTQDALELAMTQPALPAVAVAPARATAVAA